MLYKDNAAYIAQLKDGNIIKGNRVKKILPKFFFTLVLQKNGLMFGYYKFVQVKNLADMFTKALPTATFKNLVHLIGLRRLKDLE